MSEEGIVNLTGGGSPGSIAGMNRATNPYAGYRYPAEIINCWAAVSSRPRARVAA